MKKQLYEADLGDYVIDNTGWVYRVLRVIHTQGVIVTKSLQKDTPGITGWNLDGSLEKWPYEDRENRDNHKETRKLIGFIDIKNHPEYLI